MNAFGWALIFWGTSKIDSGTTQADCTTRAVLQSPDPCSQEIQDNMARYYFEAKRRREYKDGSGDTENDR